MIVLVNLMNAVYVMVMASQMVHVIVRVMYLIVMMNVVVMLW